MLGLPEAGLNYDAQLKTNQTNLQIARETNAANVAMTQETNAANIQMNAENNLLQQQLANQAYERSTAKNQLAELMAAGLTYQQALQAIAGNGEGASDFPVATTTPGQAVAPQEQMPAPLVAPQLNDPTAGALESSLFGALASSLNASDGGALGWSVAQDYISGVMEFLDEGIMLSDDVTNPADFRAFVDSLKEDDPNKSRLQEFMNSSAFKKVRSFVPASRALNSFFEQNLALKSSRQQVEESYARTMLQQKNLEYVNTQITAQNLENLNTELGVTKNVLLFDADLNVCYKNLQNALTIANRDYDVNKRTYKMFVENAVKDVENQKALLDLTDKMISIRSKIADGSIQGLSDDAALIQGYYLSAKESGLLDATTVGALISSTIAVGNEGIQIIQQLFDNIKKLAETDTGSNNPFTAPPHQTRVTETWRSIL